MSQDKGVDIHLQTQPQRKWMPCPFREVIDQLDQDLDFLQISRSCIVNLNDVLYLGSSSFHMKHGESLPISRRERQEVQDRYNDFLFRKMTQVKEMLL